MSLDLTTPALLFPAISLLLLAYTNRFLTISGLIRGLAQKYRENPDDVIYGQIVNLRKRVNLIKSMQLHGVLSLFLCVFCMFLLFANYVLPSIYVFGAALLFLLYSLAISMREIYISVEALNLQLSLIESNPVIKKEKPQKKQ
ncbi:Protein of unknown function (DUF2721) [Cyclonatronum proteinivorum]|uniref:DUF2721 domain-containing protein n=1 Tax=Cyclonatronum proteinivorum TaxID=1457365 RepID=A0A345ULB6_9BACT|nr:DUF2721 domain-containing protein [Cyclonatronum proteinivorum]AXJ01268.1 Protein of unknown function (DUF2721) [Cyclonatronum proteinivorum]